MSLLPRRKQNESLTLENAFDDFWKDFSGSFERMPSRLPAAFQAAKFPPMNVSETENSILVSLELPGLDVKDIDIQLMGDQLQISGERKWEMEKKKKEYVRVESQYGAFERSLTLPRNANLDPKALSADYKKGILEITIPKLQPTPTAKITVKAD
jgi:HSP20 family protein